MRAAVSGTELRRLRKALGLTLAEVADGIVTVGFLSAVETGNKLIHRDKLAALVARLEQAAKDLAVTEPEAVSKSLHARLRLAISSGDRELAESLRQELRVASIGDDPELMLAEGQVESVFGDPALAFDYLQTAVWRLPRFSRAWYRAVIEFCHLCTELGREVEALTVGVEAVDRPQTAELEPDFQLELRATVSGVFNSVGDCQAALRILDAPSSVVAAATDWGRVTLLWSRLMAYELLGDFDKAARVGEEALHLLGPLRRDLTLARLKNTVAAVEILRREPNWDRAERLLSEAIDTLRRLASNGDLSRTLGTAGDMWSRRGDSEAAASCFQQAIQAAPPNSTSIRAEIHIEYATSLLRTNDIPMARAQLQEAGLLLRADGRTRFHAQLWHRLALLFERAGDIEAAMFCIKESAK